MEELADLSVLPLEEILKAKEILDNHGLIPTPLVELNYQVPGKKIFLKLENFQPVRSFKIRGACSALFQLPKESIQDGVYTCSAGNFAQGLAWSADKMGIPCRIIVPESAPKTKVDAIERLGGLVQKVPYGEWWSVMVNGHCEGVDGKFIHPVCERAVLAGNGTIGLEILEELPNVDTVICAWGGGGHSCGIASALRAQKPEVKVIACEVDTGSPLSLSLKAGTPTTVPDHKPSFVDGMNGRALFPAMWNLAQNLVNRSVVLDSKSICDAVRLLIERNCIVAEGAGAAPVAAALTEPVPEGNIVCVISGGNIDAGVLSRILQGENVQ